MSWGPRRRCLPLQKNKLDDAAVELIREWIIGLGELPVDFVSFEGVLDQDVAHLRWETASETNNAGFVIERKVNEEWLQVAFVDGQGTSNVSRVYEYADQIPFDVAAIIQYRLKQIDFDGTFEYSDPVELVVNPPEVLTLHENYPDPFNPQTTISYELAVDGLVNLSVYDLQGRLVRELVDEEQRAGRYEVLFDAQNLASGTYLYRIQTGGRTVSNTMVLLK